MNKLLKSFVRETTPPLIFRGLRSLFHLLFPDKKKKREMKSWGERSAEWYDGVYGGSVEYRKHYTQSAYYFLWTVMADRMMRHCVDRVLDLGCGPGQFGALLYEKGFRQYCGVDFSSECVELAKQMCPSFEFIVANVLETNVLESRDYDCLLAMEFLEHVEEDLKVLQRVKAGTKLFGTVPNFPSVSHVRYFSSAEEVESRYAALFSAFRVDSFLKGAEGPTFYLFEGTKL